MLSILDDMHCLILSIVLIELLITITTIHSHETRLLTTERIECYPERESSYSNYSKEACLARNCIFDDNASSNVIQCYLNPNYGYNLQSNVETLSNGLRLRLRRNQTINSPFPEPINNVILDVHYYTNDIIRFKLYDGDNQRYEVSIVK